MHIHTQFCLACSSTFSCLKQTGSSQIKLDWTEFGKKAEWETSLMFIFLIVCLRYSGICRSSVSAFGDFFFFLFFGTPPTCLLDSENWTLGIKTGPDRLVWRAYERKKLRLKDKQASSVWWAEFIKMAASTFVINTAFTPEQNNWMPKSVTRFDWGRTGQ